MQNIELYDRDGHRFVLLNESDPGEEEGVRSNQYLVQHGDSGVLLDPGGFGVMPRVLTELLRYGTPDQIKAIILSHQDPDIVGGISTWLELTTAPVYISRIWLRFIPHYGIEDVHRFQPIPDAGMRLEVAPGFELELVPAHFLHSEGQMNVYDPLSKVLFSGDIGAAMMPSDNDEPFVDDFAAHLPHIEGFHRRYMCGNRAARSWVERVRQLGIEQLAPQHGPIYRGTAVVAFLDWFEQLPCGMDLLPQILSEQPL